MTDDGVIFRATIDGDGQTWHRETANRADLIAWLAAHTGAGRRAVRLSMEATTPDAIRRMLAALMFGADRQAGRR
jgi:hypothetical protein